MTINIERESYEVKKEDYNSYRDKDTRNSMKILNMQNLQSDSYLSNV
jgi:hypothetical protein